LLIISLLQAKVAIYFCHFSLGFRFVRFWKLWG